MAEKKTIIEVSGVKFEVDLRTARRIENIKVGDLVKILKKEYSSHSVHPGVVVGFEPFQKLPTIVIAYVELSWNSSDLKFLHFNAETKDHEVLLAGEEFDLDRDQILKSFDKAIDTKQRELQDLESKRKYFETKFRQYWSPVHLIEREE
jgi:hypothetical protein